MHWRLVLKIVATLSFFIGLAMTAPLAVGLHYGDASVKPLVLSIAVTLVCASLLYALNRGAKADPMSARDGMAIVAIGWTVSGLVGALPFHFSGEFASFTDAFFESVSGFTTTGSSVLTDIESVSRGLLFWRSLIQWLGGMGIIVLSVAILPFLGVGGMQLYKAEVPSPVPDKLKPRIRDTAMVLWKVYAAISAAEVLLLMLGGLSLYDALCHTFTTMPTGGFSTRNGSIGHYQSAYVDGVVIFFMMLSGINFSLHYQMTRGRPLALWRDPECRFFLSAVLCFILLVVFDLYGRSVYPSLSQAVRYGAFQVVSIVTTTGYATADYEKWPPMAQMVIFFAMFLGASAGSTGGGIKCLRVLLLIKYCYRELFTLIHPRAVVHIKIAGNPVPDDVVRSVMGFLGLYLLLFAASAVLLAGLGVDFLTSLSAVATAIGNVGPGFGAVGPAENFAAIPLAGKWLLIWCMLLGRLEVFTVVILLVPVFWQR